ncbi:hypothetical protein R2083_09300 [Nitrosomonas sp. Is35]|uniref:hypothetical protein n=1 Tax=Nitrosomonas sp. Is35 TaxID=3080534 RepID=UPI00294AAF07|nr:hypothetical protein [Nitrosomonas sp. Is35]MDV6347712.1 hypothetical protein [Nitrosomonas sp. Is35]
MPVIYIPQGLSTPLSLIGTFCVNGTYHTKYVLGQLQQLKNLSNPQSAAQVLGSPVAPNYTLDLQNTDAAGQVAATYAVPATHVQNVLQHVGFNNIPFDHSIGVLGVFLNMFCPTDNLHLGELLGYYRQREWRLIAGDIRINSRPMGRELSDAEKQRLATVDSIFWNRQLDVDGKSVPRKDLAFIYDPVPGWNPFDLIESIHAPSSALTRIKQIVGNKVPVHKV